ncbi:hypothetical protein ACS0TY_031060 [Phlomoides rotata]
MSMPPLEDDAIDAQYDPHLQTQSYLLPSINSTLFIRQLSSQGLSFQLWPAAASLVALLDRQSACLFGCSPAQARRLRILELGSGTGLVGIAAAALLGARVTVTDLPHVLPNLQFNVDANAAALGLRGGAVEVAPLSWGETQQMDAVGRDYDVVLGSDVVYHDHLYEPLLQTLRYYLLESDNSVVFVMAHLKRWKKESAFFKKAKKKFDVEIIHADAPCNGSRVGVTVYRFVRRGTPPSHVSF